MAAGYGAGRVTIGTSQVGRVAVTNVAPVPALSPRIRFGLSWTLGHRVISQHGRAHEEYRVVDFRGELRLGADDLLVGTLAREGPRRPLRSFDYVDTQDTSVALDLGGFRLERLEERRAGGALALTMRLWPRIEMGGATTAAQVEDIRFQVPRDDWLAALSTLTGEQVDLLEIRYHLVYANGYPTSLAARSPATVERGARDQHAVVVPRGVSPTTGKPNVGRSGHMLSRIQSMSLCVLASGRVRASSAMFCIRSSRRSSFRQISSAVASRRRPASASRLAASIRCGRAPSLRRSGRVQGGRGG